MYNSTWKHPFQRALFKFRFSSFLPLSSHWAYVDLLKPRSASTAFITLRLIHSRWYQRRALFALYSNNHRPRSFCQGGYRSILNSSSSRLLDFLPPLGFLPVDIEKRLDESLGKTGDQKSSPEIRAISFSACCISSAFELSRFFTLCIRDSNSLVHSIWSVGWQGA